MLPHPLTDVFAKLRRSYCLLLELDHLIADYVSRGPIGKRFTFDPERRSYTFYVVEKERIPLQVQILASEVVNHQRSALDYLAWQLALLNEPDPVSTTAFPIVADAANYKGVSKDKIRSLSPEARVRVEAMQPFNFESPNAHPLLLLNRLANDDKHRLLTVIAMMTRGMGIVQVFPFHTLTQTLRNFQDGGELGVLELGPDDPAIEGEPPVGFMYGLGFPLREGQAVRTAVESLHFFGTAVENVVKTFEDMFPARTQENFRELTIPNSPVV